jgi:hypothetical protein
MSELIVIPLAVCGFYTQTHTEGLLAGKNEENRATDGACQP